ncbi:MAG: DUF1840 domain-containing protein [Caldimonas sp.]
MYRFESRADADLLMMTPVGEQLLRIIGKEPTAQGIIQSTDLPAAIAALQQAIAAADAARTPSREQGDDEADGARSVGLAQRAWPLLEMMRRSLADKSDVVWGV